MRGMGMSFGHMNGVLALIALALAYIVLTLANKEKGFLRAMGNVIGLSIIILSGLLILAKLTLFFASDFPCGTRTMQQKTMDKQMSAPATVVPKK